MKKVTLEEFNKALSKADETTKELIGSTKIYDSVEENFKKTGISVAVEDTLLPLGYYLLNLITIDELLEGLRSLGVPEAPKFISDTTMDLKSEKVDTTTSNENSNVTPPEKTLPVPPTPNIRTLANDMANSQKKEEVVYSNTQEAILREGKGNK